MLPLAERKIGGKAAYKVVCDIEATRAVVGVEVVLVLWAVTGGVSIDARFRRLVVQAVRVGVAKDSTVISAGVFQFGLQSVVVGIEVVEVIENVADVWIRNACGSRSGICRVVFS